MRPAGNDALERFLPGVVDSAMREASGNTCLVRTGECRIFEWMRIPAVAAARAPTSTFPLRCDNGEGEVSPPSDPEWFNRRP